MKHLRAFTAALCFLSRLLPRTRPTEEDIARCTAWMPLVGVVLGLLTALPALLGLAAKQPYVQALLTLLVNLYLTRCLHLDGWADVWDGWGSFKQGDGFWEVLKDSRVGAFGVIGLVLALCGWIILYGPCLSAKAWPVLVWGAILGRTASLVLASLGRNLARAQGLGRLFLTGATPGRTAFGLLTLAASAALLARVIPPLALLLSLLLAASAVLTLIALARRQSGLNGDFLGAAIIACELCAPLAWVLVA